MDRQITHKSKKRIHDHGEVFTQKREVNAMLDIVKRETERIDSRFLEPACGTGNFLVEILNRKLSVVKTKYSKNQIEYERYAIIAVSSIYGIDLLTDNIKDCVNRLFDIFNAQYFSLYKEKCLEECKNTVRFILEKNIILGDALTLKTPDETKPIIFSEWSPINGNTIKRRDYTLANLLESRPVEGLNLFSDLGDKAFIPTPIADFPPVHYLKIGNI